MDLHNFSIIIPCYNESANLDQLLQKLSSDFGKCEIIIVDDCSTDNSFEIASKHNVKIIKHPYNMGNGATIKTGARNARGEVLIFMDADGQHDPDNISELIEKYNEGYDMVVGSRSFNDHTGIMRWSANKVYNKIASWMSGKKIKDLTSGFRVVNRNKFLEFIELLPNGFSYPTTITMAFFRSAYSVAYVSIKMPKRKGKSHINIFRDGIRFFLIIFKVGTLYSPLKLYFPISLLFFMLASMHYAFTFITEHRFTNMSALLYITSLLIFLIGLVSEQITNLFYLLSKNQRK